MITYTRKENTFHINVALIGHLSEANIMAIILATENYLLNTDMPIFYTVDCTQLATRLNYVNKKKLGIFFSEFSAGRIEKLALIYSSKQMEAIEEKLLTKINTIGTLPMKPFLTREDADEWLMPDGLARFLRFQKKEISVIKTETENSEIIAGSNGDIFSEGIMQAEESNIKELKEEHLLIEEGLNVASEEMEQHYDESVHAEGAYCSKHDDTLIDLEEKGHEEIFSKYGEEPELPENTILFKGAPDSSYEIELVNDPYEKYFSAVS